ERLGDARVVPGRDRERVERIIGRPAEEAIDWADLVDELRTATGHVHRDGESLAFERGCRIPGAGSAPQALEHVVEGSRFTAADCNPVVPLVSLNMPDGTEDTRRRLKPGIVEWLGNEAPDGAHPRGLARIRDDGGGCARCPEGDRQQ